MNLPGNPSPELRELIAQAIDDELSPAQAKRLNEILRTDAVAREIYLSQVALHAQLDTTAYEQSALKDLAAVAKAPDSMLGGELAGGPKALWLIRTKWREALALAAVVALVANLTWLFRSDPLNPPVVTSPSATGEFVATLAGAEDCLWSAGAMRLGERLARGPIRLERGQALINFDGGARLVMMGPAEIVLDSAGSARLVRGRIAARAPEEAIGFRVITPEGTVVDLGTEFVVEVDEHGKTECEVLSGVVQWQPRQVAAKIALLEVGNARRFEEGRAEVIRASTSRYEDFLPTASRRGEEGELLAYEPFDYQGSRVSVDVLNGGKGWRSSWHGRYVQSDTIDKDAEMELQPGQSLSFDGLATSEGGSVVFDGGGQWRLRRLPQPIDFSTDGIYYVSFLVRRTAIGQRGDGASAPQAPGRMVMNFRNEKDYWSHWIGFAISSSSQPFIIADGNNHGSARELDLSKPCLVVCKIATSRDRSDQLFMKVYEQGEKIDGNETARWTIVSRPFEINASMDLIIPSMTGPGRWEMDEIRYGTSWAAVTPGNSMPSRPGVALKSELEAVSSLTFASAR